MNKLIGLTILLVILPSIVHLWGQDGHKLTASIAQTRLTASAARAARRILPEVNGELTRVADWADKIRRNPQYQWAKTLHFADTVAWQCYYNNETECLDQQCVVGAVSNFTSNLQNENNVDDSMRFLTHFMGDIHQPLHVGFRKDRGGNSLKGYFYNRHTNLHHVWDSSIIQEQMNTNFFGDYDTYLDYLLNKTNTEFQGNLTSWEKCPNNAISCPVHYAEESVKVACNSAYTDSNGFHVQNHFELGQDYFEATIAVVEEQLIKGGVRLAAVLNRLYPF